MARDTDLFITIPRTALIDELGTKKTTLVAEYDAKIKAITDERDGQPAVRKALTDWYAKVAALLAAGDIEVGNAKGDFRATDPAVNVDDILPNKPSTNGLSATKRELTKKAEDYAASRDQAVANIDAAIRLLTLATDNTVKVPVSEYESLLAGRIRPGYWY